MATVGRNARCPCGSGRKYKRCCQLEAERLAQQARDDSRVGEAIADWSAREYPGELERLAEAHGLPRNAAGLAEVFRVASRELLRFVPPSRLSEPSYFTAEGDPIVSARAVWRLADPDAAFVVLGTPPELLWVGESDDGTGECFQLTADRAELLARRPPLPPNALFCESSYAGFPDRIGTGTFVLAGDELRFDAISEQRLEHALELVSRRLAGNAELLRREVAPFDLDRPEREHALPSSASRRRARAFSASSRASGPDRSTVG